MRTHTNNGIERLNKSVKHYLCGNKKGVLSSLIKMLTNRFFCDIYCK